MSQSLPSEAPILCDKNAKCITRPCLGCAAAFASAGPHERICPRCKESEDWLAGAAEFALAPAEPARAPGE